MERRACERNAVSLAASTARCARRRSGSRSGKPRPGDQLPSARDPALAGYPSSDTSFPSRCMSRARCSDAKDVALSSRGGQQAAEGRCEVTLPCGPGQPVVGLLVLLHEVKRTARALGRRAARVPFELPPDRRRVDDRVAPVIERDALGKELRAEAVSLARDRIDTQDKSGLRQLSGPIGRTC